MGKRWREILALGLLVLLGIGAASAMGWYMLAGHNWNKAASQIDDLVGSMEGYTVVLCETGSAEGGGGLAAAEAEAYRDKGAKVVFLRVDELDRYDDPIVVSKGPRRVGICSMRGAYRYVELRDRVRQLERSGVDFVIVLADDGSILEGWLRGINLVVVTDPRVAGMEERQVGSAVCVGLPQASRAMAAVIAPSGVITSRIVEPEG